MMQINIELFNLESETLQDDSGMDKKLAIALDEGLPFKEFATAIKDFEALVKSATQKEYPVEWMVKVGRGSNLISLIAKEHIPAENVSRVCVTLQKNIDRFNPARHEMDTGEDATIQTLLAKLNQNAGNFSLWINDRKTSFTANDERKPKARKKEYKSYGSIDGWLKQVAIEHDDNLGIHIETPLFAKKIKCDVSADLQPNVLSCFGKRVEIEGWVTYDQMGHPKKMVVDTIETLPDRKDIPSFLELEGAFADR